MRHLNFASAATFDSRQTVPVASANTGVVVPKVSAGLSILQTRYKYSCIDQAALQTNAQRTKALGRVDTMRTATRYTFIPSFFPLPTTNSVPVATSNTGE